MKISFLRLSPYLTFDVPHPQDVSPLIDVGYMASILEAQGHEVLFIDTEAFSYSIDGVLSELEVFNPDVIGIASMTPTVNVAIELAIKIKEKKSSAFIFMFGQHSSVLPETFLYENSPIDLCVVGEPELSVKEVVECISKRKDAWGVDGIAFFDDKKGSMVVNKERDLIDDLDSLPFPKHDLFVNDGYQLYYPVPLYRKMRWGFIESSRGCPYNCIYCSPTLRMSFGKKYRARSPKNVVDEMEFLISKGVNVIFSLDDVFTFDRKRVFGICDEIEKRRLKVKWVIQTRADHVDRKMLRRMRAAGCTTLCFGIESGSDRILKILRKSETVDQMREAHRIAKEEGFLTVCYFMLGCPTETREEIEQTYELCAELKPDMIQVAYYTPYPGSLAYDELNGKDKISFNVFSHYNELTHNFSRVPTEELIKLQRMFYRRYLLSPGFMFKYLTRRMPYILFNIKSEFKLISDTLKFLLFKSQSRQ